jgi:hypothetical protein
MLLFGDPSLKRANSDAAVEYDVISDCYGHEIGELT